MSRTRAAAWESPDENGEWTECAISSQARLSARFSRREEEFPGKRRGLRRIYRRQRARASDGPGRFSRPWQSAAGLDERCEGDGGQFSGGGVYHRPWAQVTNSGQAGNRTTAPTAAGWRGTSRIRRAGGIGKAGLCLARSRPVRRSANWWSMPQGPQRSIQLPGMPGPRRCCSRHSWSTKRRSQYCS